MAKKVERVWINFKEASKHSFGFQTDVFFLRPQPARGWVEFRRVVKAKKKK